jgi:hypothetical protein
MELSVGAAVTIRLKETRGRIFVKVWPGTADHQCLTAQMRIQEAMALRGYPAPRVLAMPSALGQGWAVAMEYRRPGLATDVRLPGIRDAMAAGLARFISEARACSGWDSLPQKKLPDQRAIWPVPHNVLFDFEATAKGAEWIDEIAFGALQVMRSSKSAFVVGHHDWSAKNMRMGPTGIAVLYDWDSVFLDREAFVVGSAAAHFPVTWELDVRETPSVDEVASFICEYERARGVEFSHQEMLELEAGATFARAYKARCEHAVDLEGMRWQGSSREGLKQDGPYRFS